MRCRTMQMVRLFFGKHFLILVGTESPAMPHVAADLKQRFTQKEEPGAHTACKKKKKLLSLIIIPWD